MSSPACLSISEAIDHFGWIDDTRAKFRQAWQHGEFEVWGSPGDLHAELVLIKPVNAPNAWINERASMLTVGQVTPVPAIGTEDCRSESVFRNRLGHEFDRVFGPFREFYSIEVRGAPGAAQVAATAAEPAVKNKKLLEDDRIAVHDYVDHLLKQVYRRNTVFLSTYYALKEISDDKHSYWRGRPARVRQATIVRKIRPGLLPTHHEGAATTIAHRVHRYYTFIADKLHTPLIQEEFFKALDLLSSGQSLKDVRTTRRMSLDL